MNTTKKLSKAEKKAQALNDARKAKANRVPLAQQWANTLRSITVNTEVTVKVEPISEGIITPRASKTPVRKNLYETVQINKVKPFTIKEEVQETVVHTRTTYTIKKVGIATGIDYSMIDEDEFVGIERVTPKGTRVDKVYAESIESIFMKLAE